MREKYRPKAEKLVDQIREVMRFHHYAYRTEQTYVDWIVRFVKFHGTTHPCELGHTDIEKFLSHLAVKKHVVASTQNQDLNALLFLYRHVLDLPDRVERIDAVRSAVILLILSKFFLVAALLPYARSRLSHSFIKLLTLPNVRGQRPQLQGAGCVSRGQRPQLQGADHPTAVSDRGYSCK